MLIRAIYEVFQRELVVLLAAPVALLAQGYRNIFGPDLQCHTLHEAFRIPIHAGQGSDVNFSLNKFDMVVVDEASLISPESFNIVAATLNRVNCRPVIVIAGDKRQQQPLQNLHRRVDLERQYLHPGELSETFVAETVPEQGTQGLRRNSALSVAHAAAA